MSIADKFTYDRDKEKRRAAAVQAIMLERTEAAMVPTKPAKRCPNCGGFGDKPRCTKCGHKF